METVTIHTDGACRGNPGPGGWGALIIPEGSEEIALSGTHPESTNNRMELTAVIKALEFLRVPCRVTLVTDSTYVKNGITRHLRRWKQNGWRTASRQPVKNQDLWQLLDARARRHDIACHWVKGHSGHPQNEAADRLAGQAADKALLNSPKTA